MTQKEILIDRLSSKAAVIGIYGLGYVGLPLALRYSEAGYKVLAFDIDQSKVEKLNSGKSYIRHIQDGQPRPRGDGGPRSNT